MEKKSVRSVGVLHYYLRNFYEFLYLLFIKENFI